VAGDVDRRGVAGEAGAVEVGVAENERGRQPGEQIDAFPTADIAAVDEEFRGVVLQDRQAGGHPVGAVMGVAEDADDHEWPAYRKGRGLGNLLYDANISVMTAETEHSGALAGRNRQRNGEAAVKDDRGHSHEDPPDV